MIDFCGDAIVNAANTGPYRPLGRKLNYLVQGGLGGGGVDGAVNQYLPCTASYLEANALGCSVPEAPCFKRHERICRLTIRASGSRLEEL